mmetsp:Transcript_51350/g.116678  ORF Transcript_51350/g.116678 Transcript_51350/m.116678 type:complete len:81 (-) Transcript_51350:560-802(-)
MTATALRMLDFENLAAAPQVQVFAERKSRIYRKAEGSAASPHIHMDTRLVQLFLEGIFLLRGDCGTFEIQIDLLKLLQIL